MKDTMSDNANSNAAEFTVSEISRAVKRTVEDAYGYVRVRGEISGFRGQHGSGHAYFALKDDKSRIESVIWKGVYNKLKVKPEEGLEVIATGKITTYPGSSKYQIVIESLEPAGVGALMALLEERKRKLTAEGLFDPARKQLLPYLPKVIGVITSPTGAVIRDIMHRLDDRFPTHVLLWPVRVQGETSGDEVANAIRGFNQFDGSNGLLKPDLLIVARGGGSLEDLWGFNDEAVVRAAADSDIPLISAVGHETDWTLIDYASDQRAPTPTGAAEMAVPVRADLLAAIDDLNRRNKGAIGRHLENQKNHLRGLSRALPSLSSLLALPRQRLDEATGRLPRAIGNTMRDYRNRLSASQGRLSINTLAQSLDIARRRLTEQSGKASAALGRRASIGRNQLTSVASRLTPHTLLRKVETHQTQLTQLRARADRAIKGLQESRKASFERLSGVLKLVSYESVLARGFALVRNDQNEPVRSITGIAAGATYRVQLADGHTDMVGGDTSTGTAVKPAKPMATKPKATKPKAKAPNDDNQGNLF